MCVPLKTRNQLFASETRSIGHDASRNRSLNFPGEFPQRELEPMLTTFGVPKFPHTRIKSGLGEASAAARQPSAASRD